VMQGHEEQLWLQLASHLSQSIAQTTGKHSQCATKCSFFVLIDTLSFMPSWKKTSNPMSKNLSDVTIDKAGEYPPSSLEIEIPPQISTMHCLLT
jgi:hypothetical protein